MHLKAADAALMIAALGILWSLYRAHRDQSFEFNLLDLLMENGRVSKVACIVMGAFAVTSWTFLRLTIDGKMTEGYLTAYAGIWVAPMIAKMFSPPPPPGTTTVTENKTTIKSTEVAPI